MDASPAEAWNEPEKLPDVREWLKEPRSEAEQARFWTTGGRTTASTSPAVGVPVEGADTGRCFVSSCVAPNCCE